MSERDVERAGDVPSDGEALVGDTAASDPRSDRQSVQPSEASSREASVLTPDSLVSPRGAEPESVEAYVESEDRDPE